MSAAGRTSAPSLGPVPPGYAATRDALHRLAAEVVSPAQERVNGEIALRATPGGFGTPPFGDGEEVRIDGTEIVRGGPAGEHREATDVDPAGARFLAEWFAFGTAVLARLLAETGPELDPSPIRLWPEHFDVAIELGAEAAGRRAALGASPGDEEHAEPYVYVAPWVPDAATGAGWNATGFRGAELSYAELLAAPDPAELALDLLRDRLGVLNP